MAHARTVLLPLLAATLGVVALAPGCSNNGPATQQAAIHFVIGTSSQTCQVGQGVDWKVGDPATVTTVGDGGKSQNGAPVSVQCSVSGNDTSGYNVTATVKNGSIGSFLVSGKFPGPVNGVVPTATGIHAEFNSGQVFIASLSENDCKVTFNGNAGQGIAPTRIWGYIDCPQAVDDNKGDSCDANAEFLFEDCSS